MRGLEPTVHAVLDRRLAPAAAAPIAIGLSGGGDSRALLLTTESWARAHGRRLVVLTVDHRLNPQSSAWTADCAALAARLGLPFQALAWEGEKPAAGLPAAARLARHRLLANAARAHGASVILLGHTAGDLAEAAAMRQAGSTTPSPREWAPSPVWPEGRGLFLLRPMLHLSRPDIRGWLADHGESWIDDPSNDDLRFARARARASAPPDASPALGDGDDLAALARTAEVDAAGVIYLGRQAPPERFIAIASLCAAGSSRPPRADRLARVAALLQGGAPLVATLAGARIEADAEQVRFMREPGELARTGLPPLHIKPGETAAWDGRFEIAAERAMTITPLAGHAASLPPDQAAEVRHFPVKARAALPFEIGQGLAPRRALARQRLLAACGAITRELV